MLQATHFVSIYMDNLLPIQKLKGPINGFLTLRICRDS